jgi:hypothetical protein
MSKVSQLLPKMKETQCDFEWYPSTPEILSTVSDDIRSYFYIRENDQCFESVLDIGAGDGRVLTALTDGKKYAIEKSRVLLDNLPSNVFVVGTDFHQQTLIDKAVKIIYSNPPYSEYADWAVKIILESNAQIAYLIIPKRWEDNETIKDALERRRAETTVLGEYSFINAERSARCVVNVVRINFDGGFGRRSNHLSVNPFDIWFEASFPINAPKSYGKRSEWQVRQDVEASMQSNIKSGGELVSSKGIVHILVECYNHDMDNLMNTYKQLSEIDSTLLKELDVNFSSVKEALKLKITSLKDVYWKELFSRLNTITDKLSFASRKSITDVLFAATHVDFTPENAHSLAVWVVKNANVYLDSQLITLVERMTEVANIKNYTSNDRTFGKEDWKYRSKPKNLSHYKLDYRIVLERVGGLAGEAKLSSGAAELLGDIKTIAYNIGFDTANMTQPADMTWGTHVKNDFLFRNHTTGKTEVLFEARAFKNGNLHLRLKPEFICKLNVEFGRLKGWLKDTAQAAHELDASIEQVESAFNSNLKLGNKSFHNLLGHAA